MSYSKNSILIVEDDSHISRVVRNHLEEAFQNVRVTIAGSPQKAKEVTDRFQPDFIIWDGAPNERGTTEEYINCIPATLWPKVLPISVDTKLLDIAKERGAHAPISKREKAINSWSEEIVAYIKSRLPKKKR